MHASLVQNIYELTIITLDINIDCTEINQIIKTHAQNELQNQREKLTKFTLKNIEFWKQEIIVCNDKIVENDAYIQQNRLSKQEIDNIILTNTDLYKTRCEYEKLVNDSNADTNKIQTIENNIEKLEKLIKILYCENNQPNSEKEHSYAYEIRPNSYFQLPEVPTHCPVVYTSESCFADPTAPNEVALLTPTTNVISSDVVPVATIVKQT